MSHSLRDKNQTSKISAIFQNMYHVDDVELHNTGKHQDDLRMFLDEI